MILPVLYDELNQRQRREVREAYVLAQRGRCYHCEGRLDEEPPRHIQELPINWRLFPPGFTRWPVHLHHCRQTGLTIGAVHSLCNAVLWQYHGE